MWGIKKNKSLYSQVCVFFVTEIPAKRKQTMKKSKKEPEQTLIYMELLREELSDNSDEEEDLEFEHTVTVQGHWHGRPRAPTCAG